VKVVSKLLLAISVASDIVSPVSLSQPHTVQHREIATLLH
jgi:hypothetical protein